MQMLISCSGIFQRLKSFWHDYFFLNFVLQLSDNSVLVFVIFPTLRYMKNDGCRKSLHKIVQLVAITLLFGSISYIIFLLS